MTMNLEVDSSAVPGKCTPLDGDRDASLEEEFLMALDLASRLINGSSRGGDILQLFRLARQLYKKRGVTGFLLVCNWFAR